MVKYKKFCNFSCGLYNLYSVTGQRGIKITEFGAFVVLRWFDGLWITIIMVHHKMDQIDNCTLHIGPYWKRYCTKLIQLTIENSTVHNGSDWQRYTMDQNDNGRVHNGSEWQRYGTQWIRMTTVQYTMDQINNGTVQNGSDWQQFSTQFN